ncbi:MAG: ABC transporter permease [Candidatus Omnitrophica bacterium]|nr:ABC transporter permease [Candidatus Omnitrophota bacterium]
MNPLPFSQKLIARLTPIRQYAALIWHLALADMRVRYKSPLLGFLWAFLVPLLLSGVFWVAFTYIFPMSSGRYPFFIFLIVGMFPWSFFQAAISGSTMSILHGAHLIKKVNFPREVIPLSVVGANLIHFLLTYFVVLVLAFAVGVPLSLWVWTLPLIILVQVIMMAGLSLMVAGMQVKYRDVKYVVDLLLTLWFYATPVLYPFQALANLPRPLYLLGLLNPMSHLVYLYRVAVLKGYPTEFPAPWSTPEVAAAAILSAMILFWAGSRIFNYYEPSFAEQVH